MLIESLEPRQMLTSAWLVDGTLYVAGVWGDDDIRIEWVRSETSTPAHAVWDCQLRLGRLGTEHFVLQTFPESAVSQIVIMGGTGDDRIVVLNDDSNDLTTPPVPCVIYGGTGKDTLIGGWGNDTLYGGPGADILVGARGEDEIRGRRGYDTLVGGDGIDELCGGIGVDSLADPGDERDSINSIENLTGQVVMQGLIMGLWSPVAPITSHILYRGTMSWIQLVGDIGSFGGEQVQVTGTLIINGSDVELSISHMELIA